MVSPAQQSPCAVVSIWDRPSGKRGKGHLESSPYKGDTIVAAFLLPVQPMEIVTLPSSGFQPAHTV
jgi:hypothetical protein